MAEIIENRGRWNALVRRLSNLSRYHTEVGFPLSGKVEEPSRVGSGHEPARSMVDLAFIASVHEYGTRDGRVPARPFFRPALDGNREAISEIQDVALARVVRGTCTVKEGLALVGEKACSLIRKQIRALKWPPLKPTTIKRKGSSKLLIDTGQLINSVQHVERVRGA